MSQNPYGSYGSNEPQNNPQTPGTDQPAPYGQQAPSTSSPYGSSYNSPYSSPASNDQPGEQGGAYATPSAQGYPTYGEQNSTYPSNSYTADNYSANQYGNTYGGVQALSKPRPHVGLGGAVSRWGKNLFHFSGRASRSEFWWIYGLLSVLMLVLCLIFVIWFVNGSVAYSNVQEAYEASAKTSADTQKFTAYEDRFALSTLGWIVGLGVAGFLVFLSTLSLQWRRLQDAGFHGAITLLNFFSLSIVPFILSFFPSKPEGYRFDKQVDIDRP